MKKVVVFIAAWLPFLALWVLFALQAGNLTLWQVLPRSIEAVAAAALLGLAVSRFCARMPWPGEMRVRFYAMHILAAVLYSAAWVAAVDVVEPSEWSMLISSRIIGRQLGMGVWIYAIIAGISYAIQTQRRVLQTEKSLAVARLDALRSRLHPHFLFNALHTVGALVRHDPAEAEGAIEKLGDMLRYSLRDSAGDTVPFSEEWEFTRRYLDFEQLRYGARLNVVTEIDPRSLACSAPSFALQTLVENSVRHSISRRAEGGRVDISARVGDDRLHIRVWNDGAAGSVAADAPGRRPAPEAGAATQSGARYGLHALRERLDAVYGADAQLDIARDDAGFEVSFTIPCVRPEGDDDE
ncbi:MAG: histidine kinase [Acidobacteriota bacterium]